MSFTARFEPPRTGEFDVDLTPCETCQHRNYDYECGQIGYCITSCGEQYVISEILNEKGYYQVNIDWAIIDGVLIEGIELYERQSINFMENLQRLGYESTLHHHPMQKNYLRTIVITGYNPIELAHIFQELDEIK